MRDSDELISTWHQELQELSSLCEGLDEQQWRAPTPCPGWSVADVVAHVIDIEELLAARPRPAHEPDWATLPHVDRELSRFTEVGVDFRRGRTRAEVLGELRTVTAERLLQLRSVPPGVEVLSARGNPTTIEKLMRVRIFDIWAHDQDIRWATGLTGNWDSPAAQESISFMIRALPEPWSAERSDDRIALNREGASALMSVPTYVFLCLGRVTPAEVADDVETDGDFDMVADLLARLTIAP